MLKLTIVTPERRLIVNQEVDEVTVPAFNGEINVLEGHAPLISTLGTGVIKWKLKSKEQADLAAISWGYCQVSPEGVNVLADIVDLPEEVDVTDAKEQYDRAEKRIFNDMITEDEMLELTKEIAHARVKLELAERVLK